MTAAILDDLSMYEKDYLSTGKLFFYISPVIIIGRYVNLSFNFRILDMGARKRLTNSIRTFYIK